MKKVKLLSIYIKFVAQFYPSNICIAFFRRLISKMMEKSNALVPAIRKFRRLLTAAIVSFTFPFRRPRTRLALLVWL